MPLTLTIDHPNDVPAPGQVSPATDLVRVLHLINGEHYSGAERVQDLLALGLIERGYQAGFACLKPDRFPACRQAVDAPLYPVPMTHKLDLRVAWKLAQIIRRENYRLVHAHTPRSALVGRLAARLARVPMVYHVHSPTSRDTTHVWRNRINNWNERFNLRDARVLIAVSHSLARHMRLQGYCEKRVTVVPNGVPAPAVQRGETPPAGTWTIGTVALFRPRKGLEVLLDALAQLKRENAPVQLQAVGPFESPEYEASVKGHANRLGIQDMIRWTGFTKDVAKELAGMDLFVLPSLFGEGLPMVVLEAMAAGVPVIGSRVEGVPEAIDEGVSGLLAEPGEARDLADCIRRVVSGELDWSRLRNNGLRLHAESFSDRAMAAKVAQVYDRILAGR